jgi:catechol 2,3-dioxygenase-like lactoylglutathione lyase family enzyme
VLQVDCGWYLAQHLPQGRGQVAIIPIVRCKNLKASIGFYTTVLDFILADGPDSPSDPSAAVLNREGDVLILSSHTGDGEFGQAVVVMTKDVDGLVERFLSRGLAVPERDSPVHRGAVDQSWGTREFYADDPDGNTIRFTQNQDLAV